MKSRQQVIYRYSFNQMAGDFTLVSVVALATDSEANPPLTHPDPGWDVSRSQVLCQVTITQHSIHVPFSRIICESKSLTYRPNLPVSRAGHPRRSRYEEKC